MQFDQECRAARSAELCAPGCPTPPAHSSDSQAQQQLAIVHRLSRENAKLVQERNALNDPSTIERDARALGMVRPGEHPYVVTGLPHH